MTDQESANVITTRTVIDLVSAFKFDELAPFIHEDIIVDTPYQAFHVGVLKRGKDQFIEGMKFVPNVFKTFTLSIHEVYDCPSRDVVVFEQTSFGIFAAAPAKSYQNRYIMVFGFRDGQINLWREFFNPEVMNASMAFMLDLPSE